MSFTPEEQLAALAENTVDLVRSEELLAKLRRGKPLVVKLGCDPSAPDLHLGHLVVLRKLRQFQEFGHDVVFVVGDFTAQIGDPSGRSRTRPALSAEQIETNAQTYRDQVRLVLDPERTRLVHNAEWLNQLGSIGWVKLAAQTTVARILERDDFSKRYHAGQPISLHEFLYPLAQAYDSVAIRADVELGGTDQTFNLLLGRDLQREHGQEPQVVITMPLLVGLDGSEKMSKSLGNYVALTDPPEQMYGKLMSLSDEQMWTYWSLLTDVANDVIRGRKAQVADGQEHPMRVKQELARRLVADLHGPVHASAAEEAFERVFRDRKLPEELPEFTLDAQPDPIYLARVLVIAELAKSAAEARRLIQSGAVRVGGVRPETDSLEGFAGSTYEIQVGKRRFARIRFR